MGGQADWQGEVLKQANMLQRISENGKIRTKNLIWKLFFVKP